MSEMWGLNSQNKHSAALHECYLNLGAAEKTDFKPTPDARVHLKQDDKREFTVIKVTSIDKPILLRTSAVRVVNPDTGVSTLAYAQNDTVLKLLLFRIILKKNLGLMPLPILL